MILFRPYFGMFIFIYNADYMYSTYHLVYCLLITTSIFCMYIIIIPLYLTCSTRTVLQTLHLPLSSLLFVTISYPDVKFKFTYSTVSLCTSNWILFFFFFLTFINIYLSEHIYTED